MLHGELVLLLIFDPQDYTNDVSDGLCFIEQDIFIECKKMQNLTS